MTYYKHWADLYQTRQVFLKASDWTQMTDSPLSDEKKAEWAVYRQALRDLPLKWPSDVNKETVNPHSTKNLFPQRPQ